MFFRQQIKAYFIRFLTRKKTTIFEIKNTRNILFFRYDRIGDMVITTPVFRELKLAYPEINISVLASELNRGVLVNNPYVDKIYTNYKNNLLGDFPTLLKLRKMKFDACVEFDHSVIPHAIIRLRIINPKKVISVFKEGRYGLQGKDLEIYDYYTEKPKNSHFRDIWLNTLNPFGIQPESKKYDLFCTDQQKEKAINFLLQFRNKIIIGINLEGAIKGKRITSEKLKAICRGLYQANKDVLIILLSSPKNYEDIIRLSKNMELPYVFPSYKTESIIDVAALIQNLQLIITPDTSIVHIASAFNVPIVSIHENNMESYQLFAPKSQYSKTIFAQSAKGIDEYSINELTRYSVELISRVN